jgi:hypothetical protein
MARSPYIVVVALCFACSLARGVEVSRVLKTFDFEERRLGNQGDLPIGWMKVAGPGLPHYVNGKLANDRHRSGEYSFRFDLNGGGLIYRYPARLIKVQRGARYRVRAWCQTTPLPNARARLTAYFADIEGNRLEKSIQRSELFVSPPGDDGWHRLSLFLPDDDPDADSLVIELELLQPAQYSESRVADRELFEQDIHGSAWWDDVTVAEVPKVGLRTDHLGNVFHRGEPIRVSLLMSDRTTDDLTAHVSVLDAQGKEVYQRTGRPNLQPANAPGEGKRMILDLPPLLAGWYQVGLSLSSGGHVLENQSMSIAVLADTAGRVPPPDPRFGLIATELPFAQWGELPDLLRTMSAGRVKLAVWSKQGDVDQANGLEFDRLLQQLSELGISPTACLVAPPPKLSARMNGGGWQRLSKLAPEDWQPDLDFLISRHANHIERWQFGPDGTDAFVTDRAARDAYTRVYNEFARLINNPDLEMPWPAYYDLPADAPQAIALSVPSSVLPSQIPLYLQDIKPRAERAISVTLKPVDRARYGRDVQIRDLAQRLIYALSADAPRIDFPLPLTTTRDDIGDISEPDELLIVLRTMLTTLSGTRYRGRVALGDGIDAFLFDRGAQSIIALWGRGDANDPRELALNLGERPMRLDLWGNAAPLLQPRGEQRGRVLVNVGSMPIFLVDIDGHQAQLRASVAIDQPLLESTFRPHERRIRFVNTYDHAITGALHLRAPDGWTLTPPTFNFSLNPGEKFDQPVSILFPYSSVAGTKRLDCDFLIDGEKNPNFGVPLALKLGLSDVGMETIAMRDGHDIFVQQMITNYGDRPINYSAFAVFPGQARQERVVVNLAPGATTIRRYRFDNVPRTPKGQVHVGLHELQGNRILNDSVEVQ